MDSFLRSFGNLRGQLDPALIILRSLLTSFILVWYGPCGLLDLSTLQRQFPYLPYLSDSKLYCLLLFLENCEILKNLR